MRVCVYWNLIKGGFSVRAAEGPSRGRVIAYADSINLVDARFHVCESMRLRTICDRRRSVHAWIRGTITTDDFDVSGLVEVGYSPYRGPHFTGRVDGGPVHSAQQVLMMTLDGRASVWIG
jgi:hypothetical protein